MVNLREDRGVQVVGNETEDGVDAMGNGVELFHQVVDNFCEDIAMWWC
jgi:hypothetical protein